ncbi:MAG TPA: NnrS family protein [Bryobacteraceae bacterium]|nr:NnrS family protein [Bryobacteraceae bacterium]
MDTSGLPREWQDAFRRDAAAKPALSDPLPERRLARLLAAYVVTGLFFMTLPGTVLGVWNLVGISSGKQLAAVSAAWIQAHGHAQFFGWVGTFIIGISLYTLPKFRGSACRSVPAGWLMWAMWTTGVALRWFAGVANASHPAEFRIAAVLELVVGVLLFWQVTPSGTKHRRGQPWEVPIFGGLAALPLLLAGQLWISMQALGSPAFPAVPDRMLISLAIWAFAFPVVVGYSAKLFPGLIGTVPADKTGLRIAMSAVAVAVLAFIFDQAALAAAATGIAAAVACWSLRIFHPKGDDPKITGVYSRYPRFAFIAYVWLCVSAIAGFGGMRPGMLGASRHAFTVGFLATLIFAIGPRILPSFLSSRELWSVRLMSIALWLITAGCALRVTAEPLAYTGAVPAAWVILPVSAFTELAAVLLFGFNLAMSLAAPVPSWFGRKHVNDRMSVYWLVSSYPATRGILIESGLATLAKAARVPMSLTLGEAAQADHAAPGVLVDRLGDFFESRLAPSRRASSRASENPVTHDQIKRRPSGTE